MRRATAALILSFALAGLQASELAAQSDSSLVASGLTRVGAFYVANRMDPMSDVDRSYAAVPAQEEGELQNGLLAWRCMSDGLNVAYAPGTYLNSDDPIPLRWRLDKNDPADWVSGTPSTDGTTVFLPMMWVVTFTRGAKKASKVVVQAKDYEGTPVTETFSMAGLTQALKSLSCAKADMLVQ